jgi:hypothetical protein
MPTIVCLCTQHAALRSWAEVAEHKTWQRRRVARGRQASAQRTMSTALCTLWEQVRPLIRGLRRHGNQMTEPPVLGF